jgi:hypothetical protein
MSGSDRLESWKEIATNLNRDVTTVQRLEKKEGLPVHGHVHKKKSSAYAYRSELDARLARRGPTGLVAPRVGWFRRPRWIFIESVAVLPLENLSGDPQKSTSRTG